MDIGKRRSIQPWFPKRHASASDRIQHPGRKQNNHSGSEFNKDELTV
jgi:hypothetical protein